MAVYLGSNQVTMYGGQPQGGGGGGDAVVKSLINGSITSLTIPDDVTTIRKYMCAYTGTLESVYIHNQVTSIGEYAFRNNTALKTVVIGNGLTQIGSAAFNGCSILESVTVHALQPPTCGSNVFTNSTTKLHIYVPTESVNAYKSASGWSSYASKIQAIPE